MNDRLGRLTWLRRHASIACPHFGRFEIGTLLFDEADVPIEVSRVVARKLDRLIFCIGREEFDCRKVGDINIGAI